VSRRCQKGKTNLDFTEARDSEWQWHQPGHMQICTSLQADNHASTPPLNFTDRMPFLPTNQQLQSTESMFSSWHLFSFLFIQPSDRGITNGGRRGQLSPGAEGKGAQSYLTENILYD